LHCFEVEHDTTSYPVGLQVGSEKFFHPSFPPLTVQFVALRAR
jgi:hypothetical protein